MRKLIFAVLASVMLTACQKTDTAKSSDALAIKSSDALIISAKHFFTNDVVTSQSSVTSLNTERPGREQVMKTPLWEKAYTKHDDTKGDVVIVPLKYEKPLYFKTNFGNGTTLSIEKQSDLWIYKDVSGKNQAVVRIALPDKAYQDGIVKSFEGYVLEEDWLGNSLTKYMYKDGNVDILKTSLPASAVNNSANRYIVTCVVIDWYLCDYIDPFGVGTNCQYLYTEYVDCHEDGDGGGGDGGGGGSGFGGGGGGTGPCDVSAWSSAVTSATDLESISMINDGQETRTKTYVWVFAKGVLNSTLRWKSHETGVHYKDNNEWKWQSLVHNSVSKVGVVIGGTLNCDVNSAIATIGIYNAIMAIDYTFTWSFFCGKSPISNSENKTSAKAFNVND